jgi:Trp operon repressor
LFEIFIIDYQSFKQNDLYKYKKSMRYLVSLNKDAAFKKVFGNKYIAKAFLEDMLNIKIQSIELLERDNKITDAASVVRFDFRCRIDDQDVIIEVQQDNFNYLVKRFYLYHCLSTSLQLEVIKDRMYTDPLTGKEHHVKRYAELRPVITIIWMAEHNWGFKEDFIEFNLYPKLLADFIEDDAIWNQDKESLLNLRNELLHYLKKSDYNLDFHAENRLIYVFQTNVVKNKRNQKYAQWFEFAQKTRNVDNKAADFEPYIHNSIFSDMIQRLCTEWMEPQELRQMIGDEAYFAAKKLEEEDRESDRRFQIFDQFYQIYGDQLDADRAAERWKTTMAYQEMGVKERALLAANAKLEQLEQKNKEAAEKASLLLKKAEEKTKKAEEKAKKAEEKAKKEKIALLKAEKEKQAQVLKAEKEKQAQVLKAEKEKQALVARLKIVQKMLDKGNSVEIIADLLDASVEQVKEWITMLEK